MSLGNKEIAEKRREKTELELKREALKVELEGHRAANDLKPERLEEKLREVTGIDEQIRVLELELQAAPSTNDIGGVVQRMSNEAAVNVISKDNFRASTQYRDAFFRSLMNRSIADADKTVMSFGLQERAITDMNGLSVTSGAAYLVPESTMNEIQSIITQVSPLYNLVNKNNFEGDVTIPIGTEDTTVNESDGTDTLAFIFTELKLSQMAIVANVPVKNLLLKNSIKGFEKFIAKSIGKYIGLQLENYIVNGNTTEWQGIVTAIGASAKTYSEMDWNTIATILGSVESPYGDQGYWIMRRKTFFDQIFSLEDANGRPLVNTIPGVAGMPGAPNFVVGGRPVVFSSKVAANGVIFGDPTQFEMNISQELIIEADASAGFQADKTIWRGKVYGGGKANFATTAFAYYTKA